MNLQKLFEVQAGLKQHIGYKGEDKFPKMILAMLVEFMECANDWQGFKYWKKNNAPKTEKRVYADERRLTYTVEGNPLLEEYVDGLHFVLESGIDLLEMGFMDRLPEEITPTEPSFEKDIVTQYKIISWLALALDFDVEQGNRYTAARYRSLFEHYLALGQLLGFTEEQITAAYMDKNKVNHQRQTEGY